MIRRGAPPLECFADERGFVTKKRNKYTSAKCNKTMQLQVVTLLACKPRKQ